MDLFCYCINLESDARRREHYSDQYEETGLSYEFVKATDGRTSPIAIPQPLSISTPIGAEDYPAHTCGLHLATDPKTFAIKMLSVTRKSAFEALGGFSGRQRSGDFELWHHLAAHSGLILMPSLAWIRTHSGQQSEANRTDPRVNFRYLWLSLQLLNEFSKPSTVNTYSTLVQKKASTSHAPFCMELKDPDGEGPNP